jgi:predicted RNase H-like HicB family nuclease
MADNPELERILYQVEESPAGKGYQAFCPELVITGFGDTPEEARNALRSQVVAYLEDCDQMGNLEEVLMEAGFYYDRDDEVWVSSLVRPAPGPNIRII